MPAIYANTSEDKTIMGWISMWLSMWQNVRLCKNHSMKVNFERPWSSGPLASLQRELTLTKMRRKQSQHGKCGVANCLFSRDHMNYITHKVNYLNKILQHNWKTVFLISNPEFFCSVPIKHMTNGFNTSLARLTMITLQPPEPLLTIRVQCWHTA